ncbi:hypothetical protein [Methylocucumis oryzae]|uniref:hypothetical protein n=1 Tax=Methylocucumis oryzae TaxID=1632867 RepID=UPI000AE0F93B|nr:hypothetical protein [Methylocucumis oryzae]
MPLWLYKTQTAAYLKQTLDRKEMIEELAQELARQQVELVKTAYQHAQPLYGGMIPGDNNDDGRMAYRLINSYAVLAHAQHVARESLKSAPDALKTLKGIEQAAHKLITERPRKLQEALVKTTRIAYGNYSDEQLATLIADKRLNDYKSALINRSVQSIYSIGSTAWIIEQQTINRKALADINAVESYLAEQCGLELVQTLMTAQPA